MATCIFEGNTDMSAAFSSVFVLYTDGFYFSAYRYGLGIRLGFYLQWLGAIIAGFLVPRGHRDHRVEDPIKDEIIGLAFSNNVFAAATFLALIILLANNQYSLQPVEIYIILLLTFGYTLVLLPIYIWRVIIRCDSYWDPTRWPLITPSPVASVLRFLLVAAVASFQLWFWFVKAPQLHSFPCQQYGFFLTKLRLDSTAMQVLNIVLYFGVLLVCVALLLMWLFNIEIGKDGGQISTTQKRVLQTWNGIFSLIVAVLVVLAAELTIKWNRIRGVNNISSAGQTIPLAIGGGLLIRVLYVFLFKNPEPSDEEHFYREPSQRRTRMIRRYGAASRTATTESSGSVRDFPERLTEAAPPSRSLSPRGD